MSLSKEDLIRKLEKISVLYDKSMSIQLKMDDFIPEDNYERKILVPDFPSTYVNDADIQELEESIDHSDEDALEQMGEVYDRHYAPLKPEEPKIKNFEYSDSSESRNKQSKFGCLSYLAAGISAFFLLSLILGTADGAESTITIIAIIAAALFIVFRVVLKTEIKNNEIKKADALSLYTAKKEEILVDYQEKIKLYESDCVSYKLRKSDFLDEYVEWRKIYLEGLEEEFEIEEKLEADRIAAVEKINNEEFIPAVNDLAEFNDIVSTEYLSVIDTIIDLLKSSRADDLKEAINLYEDIVYRERQLQLQKEQEEQRRYEEECRRLDEERRHREEMEFREEQEKQRRREEERREQEAERRHREDMQARKTEERNREIRERERIRSEELKQARIKREEENKLHSAAKAQCQACAHAGKCSMTVYNKTPNCTGFTPRR